jgi:hypothetical protein
MSEKALKIALLESSALEDIDHMMDLPDETVLEQMEAHKADFLPMCWESIRKDDMTPNEMLARCYNRFCRNLASFRRSLS